MSTKSFNQQFKLQIMKKTIQNLFALTTLACMITSCGTIVGPKAQVALVDAPSGISVKANGERVDVNYEETVSSMKVGMNSDTRTSYSSPVIKVPKKTAQTIELSAGGKNGSFDTKPKGDGSVILADIFLFGGIGLIVDLVTGNIKKQTPKFIDVPAVLAGKPQSEWRSQSQLKKAIKKSAR